jgi:hypothetical protein
MPLFFLSPGERPTLLAAAASTLLVAAIACGEDATTTADPSDAATTDAATNDAANDSGGTSDGSTAASCTRDPSTATRDGEVLVAAQAFLAALTDTQRTTAVLAHTRANAEQWSNLPTTMVKRNGVPFSQMSTAAADAAVALVKKATSDQGGTLFSELRAADEYLVTNGGASSNDYGKGLYYISFIGMPSATDAWMLQVAGHHLAYNFSYNSQCTSATPLFDAVEPKTWNDGTAHAPLENQRAALTALLSSLSSSSAAKLSGTYSDLLTGPPAGSGDTKYPNSLNYPTGASDRGVLGSTLTSEQKALVKTAIEAWAKNPADPNANALLGLYESDDALNSTYIGYSGSADLSTQGSYVRIDGPRVWIEFTVQGGIVYRGQTHYHTIWRDKISDYGAEFK